MEFTTIIFVHYGQHLERTKLSVESYFSLYETVKHLPVELIVIDNGQDLETSKFFLEETNKGHITHYIRNADNVWYGKARNQALKICEGDYICVMDNDLIYKNGWLDKCLEVLKVVKGQKLLVTPMHILGCHRKRTRSEPIEINGEKYLVNTFAGSNCWLMHGEDFKKIGYFEDHYFAGTGWVKKYCQLGYGVVVIPGELVEDKGDRKMSTFGFTQYYRKIGEKKIIIKKRLLNGQEIIYFNGELW